MSSNGATVEEIELNKNVLAAIEAQEPQAGVEVPDNVTQLYLAITAGNLPKTKALLIHDPTIIDVEYKHTTPLRIAASKHHLEIVKFLLERKANVNKAYLHISDPEILRDAEKNGSLQRLRHISNSTVLHGAAENGHLEMATLLLSCRANVHAKNGNDATPLHLASQNEHSEVVRLLLNYDANVEAKNCNGQTPLYITVALGYLKISEILLKHKAAVQATYRNGKTLLHLASQNRHPAVVRLLLRYNANIDAVDIDNITPLYIAAMIGHLEIIKILLENNADIHIAYRKYKTPLQIAKEKGHLKVVNLLQSHQELCTAIRRKDASEVERLVAAGAILANQDESLLLTPELSSILFELKKQKVSMAVLSVNPGFSPKKMSFDNGFLVIDFKTDKDANHFLKMISIIFKRIDCKKTEFNFSVRLHCSFSADETFSESELCSQRKDQLEKKLNFLRKQLNASDWAITAITPGANERDKNLHIFFQKNIVGSFTLEDKQISIMIVNGGIAVTLPMELLFQQEKTVLDVYLRKIINKITEIETATAQIKKEELAQKEAEALEKLRLRAEVKAKEAAQNREKKKPKEGKESERREIISSAKEGLPHAEADDKTPLHKAVYRRNVAQATVLLHQGADINAQTKKGNTPLHVAAIKGDEIIFNLLREWPGINVTLKNEQGETALELAEKNGLIPSHDLASKKEMASNQPGKENVLLSEEQTFERTKPKSSNKKSREKAVGGAPNFFKSPVANGSQKQETPALKDSDSKGKFKPMKTLTFDQWSSHSSSLPNSNSSSSSGHGASPK